MNNKLIAKCKEFCGNNQLTLHGEILIGNSDRTQLLIGDAASNTLIKNCIEILREEFTFLDIEMVTGVAEVTIKLFAYNVYTDKQDFLDLFKYKLEEVLENIQRGNNLFAQVNVFGTFQNNNTIMEYRYLNKQSRVDYKITTSKKIPLINKLFNRKVQIFLLVIFVLVVIFPMIYNLILGNGITLVNVLDFIPAEHDLL